MGPPPPTSAVTAGTHGSRTSAVSLPTQPEVLLPQSLLVLMNADPGAQDVGALSTALLRCIDPLLPTTSFTVTSVVGGGHRSFSGERARALSELEDAANEGPTIDALRTGEPIVNVPDPLRRRRWPTVAGLLHVAGVSAAHSIPLRRGDNLLGAITVFQHRGALLPADVLDGMTTLASAAALGLDRVITLDELRRRVAQLEQALSSRVAIEQAKGVLAARLAISVDDAFLLIRQHARRHRRQLRAVSEAIVAGSLSTQELRASA